MKMLTVRLILAHLFSSFVWVDLVIGDCHINPLAKSNSPLFVKSKKSVIIYPDYGKTVLSFTKGENVDLACPGARVVLNTKHTTKVITASCVDGESFRILDQVYQWSQITCDGVTSANSRFTNEPCAGGREAEIGFDLGDGRFIRQILLCFDTDRQTTLYTQYDIVSSIGGIATCTPRPFFEQDNGFFNVGPQRVNTLYERDSQRRTINSLLGLNNGDKTYIQDGQLYFLSRGHMAARSDFFYPAQLNATFKYINAAPQWQSFNGFNWNQAEMDSRSYASTNNVTLQLWTGTYGIATLPHNSTKKDIELYLYVNGEARGIPVPAIYWKVVYNCTNKTGVVLIGLNNPYVKNGSAHEICKDVSSKISWLKWDRTNINYGYSYACSFPDFKRVIKYAPNITVSGLLS